MPPRDLEQPGPPAARLPEALAEPAHVAPGGLELLLAHHFPCADAGQNQAALHRGPEHVLRFLRGVLVDVLPARDHRDRGRGDRGYRLVPWSGVRSVVSAPARILALGSDSLAAPPPGPKAIKGGEQPGRTGPLPPPVGPDGPRCNAS